MLEQVREICARLFSCTVADIAALLAHGCRAPEAEQRKSNGKQGKAVYCVKLRRLYSKCMGIGNGDVGDSVSILGAKRRNVALFSRPIQFIECRRAMFFAFTLTKMTRTCTPGLSG